MSDQDEPIAAIRLSAPRPASPPELSFATGVLPKPEVIAREEIHGKPPMVQDSDPPKRYAVPAPIVLPRPDSNPPRASANPKPELKAVSTVSSSPLAQVPPPLPMFKPGPHTISKPITSSVRVSGPAAILPQVRSANEMAETHPWIDSDPPIAKLGDVSFFLRELAGWARQRGRLIPLLREAFVEVLLARLAGKIGLTISEEELQSAADNYRRRHSLLSAQDTDVWLRGQHLSAVDFERTLERELLIEKLRHHVTIDRIADHFAKHSDRYACVRLSVLVVASEGEGRELLHRLTDEGADFATLARTHSLIQSRRSGGDIGIVCRAALPRSIGEAIFLALPGEVVGPFLESDGYHLYRVEERFDAVLDASTSTLIREELFAEWGSEQLRGVIFDIDWLEGPNVTR